MRTPKAKIVKLFRVTFDQDEKDALRTVFGLTIYSNGEHVVLANRPLSDGELFPVLNITSPHAEDYLI